MKYFVLAILLVHFVASAPLWQVFRFKNLSYLFAEAPNGKLIEVIYGRKNDENRIPIEEPGDETDDMELNPANEFEGKEVSDDEFIPLLDAPRVEESVILAPRFKPPCEAGHRKDKHGKCRRIW